MKEDGDQALPQQVNTSSYPPFQSDANSKITNSTQSVDQSVQNIEYNIQQSVIPQTIEGTRNKPFKTILFIILGITVFLIILIIVLFILLTPTVKGLNACMLNNNQSMDLAFKRGITEKWNNQQKCSEFKPITEKLLSCYESAGRNGILPEKFAFRLGSLINSSVKNVNKESVIQLHNTNCSEYPDTLITQ